MMRNPATTGTAAVLLVLLTLAWLKPQRIDLMATDDDAMAVRIEHGVARSAGTTWTTSTAIPAMCTTTITAGTSNAVTLAR